VKVTVEVEERTQKTENHKAQQKMWQICRTNNEFALATPPWKEARST